MSILGKHKYWRGSLSSVTALELTIQNSLGLEGNLKRQFDLTLIKLKELMR